MLYLDLDRLDDFDNSALRVNRPGALSFKTQRHLCDDSRPSGEEARGLVRAQLKCGRLGPGEAPNESALLWCGFQSPVGLFSPPSRRLARCFIYEVSNTPWNEIHRYVIPYDKVASGQEYWFDKTFHVSPFNPITQRYVTKVQWPTDCHTSIYLGLQDEGADRLMFEAGLTLDLTPYNGRSVKPLFTWGLAANFFSNRSNLP